MGILAGWDRSYPGGADDVLVLIIMENFEGTRPLAVLMRYTGEAKKGERQGALNQLKGLWGKVKGTFSSDHEAKDVVK